MYMLPCNEELLAATWIKLSACMQFCRTLADDKPKDLGRDGSDLPWLDLKEEAEAVTGLSDPERAAASILERPGALTQWCVKIVACTTRWCTVS